jgi:hypothetical protein
LRDDDFNFSGQATDGLPVWITTEVIQDTLLTFRHYCDHDITMEEAIAILLNVSNLFAILDADNGDIREEDEGETAEGSDTPGQIEPPKAIRRSRAS